MNLAAFLTAPALTSPDAIAVRDGDITMSTSGLALEAAMVAGSLRAHGIDVGDRVGIACSNDRNFVVAYLGVLYAGAVAVPLNPTAPPAELAREVEGVDAKLVIAHPRVDASIGSTVVTTHSSEWDKLRAGAAQPIVDRADDDLAVLVYTSGTSGPPKAAMLTHGNLRSNIEQVLRHPGLRLGVDDVALGVLPMFHIYGLNVVLGVGLAAGATIVLADRFDGVGTAGLVQHHGVTMIAGAPPMFSAWLDTPAVPDDAFASVRLAVSGAAPLAPEVQRGFRERFGVVVHQGYGLTEAAPIVTTSAVAAVRDGSIGPALPGVDVRLVDASGDDALAGDPGEIWVRGPNVFAGYWNDRDATARVLTEDGWLRTGDIAVADDDGWLTIVDRAKDLILVSGFNVFPAEVEEVLASHPMVAEAAVVGVPDVRTGESVQAFVVLAPGATLEEAELTAFAARQLARYKCPATITFVNELPHTQAGKVLRRNLQQ